MNLTLIIRVNDISELPTALDKITKDIKSNLKICGVGMNITGVTEEGFNYQYHVDNTNYKNFREFIEPYRE